jgi:hypothetical protein
MRGLHHSVHVHHTRKGRMVGRKRERKREGFPNTETDDEQMRKCHFESTNLTPRIDMEKSDDDKSKRKGNEMSRIMIICLSIFMDLMTFLYFVVSPHTHTHSSSQTAASASVTFFRPKYCSISAGYTEVLS